MTSRVVKICFVYNRIFLFTLIDAVVKINVDELRIKVFQQFLFAYCAYEFVDEDGGNFNAIDKNFTVTRLKRTFSFKYTSSTYFRRGSNLSTKLSFSPFRSSNLHTEGDRCALTSLCQQTPLLVCARVSISANAQQFLLPSLFFLPILFQFPTPFQQKIPSSHRWYIFSRRRLWF